MDTFIKPTGSTAGFGVTKDLDSATQLNTFIPDVIGTYKVAFSDGSSLIHLLSMQLNTLVLKAELLIV